MVANIMIRIPYLLLLAGEGTGEGDDAAIGVDELHPKSSRTQIDAPFLYCRPPPGPPVKAT